MSASGQRVAVVTGGCSGLGAAASERLRSEGVDVVTIDLAPEADVVLDVADAAAVHAAMTDLGTVDIVINSAGIVGPNMPLVETPLAELERTLAVNLIGTFLMCQAFAPGMVARGWGRIVNLASMAGKEGNPNLSAYSASKAAVIGLTKSLGKELATTGVLVNAVAPALIETPMNATTAPDVLARLASLIPMQRLGRAEEVAELIAWLASDRCSFSTGAVYDISGGRATH